MKVNLAKSIKENIIIDSLSDGEGFRNVIFFQGCPHKCNGCHNKSTWDTNKGFLTDINVVKKYLYLSKNSLTDGITFSGGEPFLQKEALLELVLFCKKNKMSVWVYTGYTIENLISNNKAYKILENIDVLVDGKFILEQKSLNLKFKGSKNQRIIDVKNYLEIKRKIII